MYSTLSYFLFYSILLFKMLVVAYYIDFATHQWVTSPQFEKTLTETTKRGF